MILRTMRNWSGRGARTGLTFLATGLYLRLAANTGTGPDDWVEGKQRD